MRIAAVVYRYASEYVAGYMSESTEEDGRWLTYDQLAEFRGIDRLSAIKLVRRHQWRKQKDNHGNLLVLVPADQQGGSSKSRHKYPDTSEYEPPENFTRTLLAFQNAIASLREQLERERQRADRAEAQAGQAEEQIASLRAELAAAEAKAHAENLEALERLGHEKGRADAAEDERAALQAQLATSAFTEVVETFDNAVSGWEYDRALETFESAFRALKRGDTRAQPVCLSAFWLAVNHPTGGDAMRRGIPSVLRDYGKALGQHIEHRQRAQHALERSAPVVHQVRRHDRLGRTIARASPLIPDTQPGGGGRSPMRDPVGVCPPPRPSLPRCIGTSIERGIGTGGIRRLGEGDAAGGDHQVVRRRVHLRRGQRLHRQRQRRVGQHQHGDRVCCCPERASGPTDDLHEFALAGAPARSSAIGSG